MEMHCAIEHADEHKLGAGAKTAVVRHANLNLKAKYWGTTIN